MRLLNETAFIQFKTWLWQSHIRQDYESGHLRFGKHLY